MPRLLNKSNINTPDYWERVYRDELAHGHVRYYPSRFDDVIASFPPGPGTLLDFAGGTGEFARRVTELRPDLKVAVFERSQAAMAHGQRYPGVTYVVAPDAITTYTIVHCGQTLEHVDDPHSLVGFLWSMVAPGGKLVVTVPLGDAIQDAEHVWEFSPSELLAMMPGDHTGTRVISDPRYLMGWAVK